MNISQFTEKTNLLSLKELDKVLLLSFFYYKKEGMYEFNSENLIVWFELLHLPFPNISRLKKNISQSRSFIKGREDGYFRLHANEILRLSQDFPQLSEYSEDIVYSIDEVLPESLFLNTRGYIEKLARQINASFEHNIFDGCAVLMRRLLEILLIHSYERYNIESHIKDVDGNYKNLNVIISNAKSNSTLGLSRNTKECVDNFRIIGNFSAHKIFYNAKRDDIKKVAIEYRVTIEELLYKSGIIK